MGFVRYNIVDNQIGVIRISPFLIKLFRCPVLYSVQKFSLQVLVKNML